MSAHSRPAAILLVGAGLTFLLWPSLAWIALIPAGLAVLVIWLATQQPTRSRRWPNFALRGAITGVVVGSLGVFGLVRLTGWGATEGWEDVVAIVLGMMAGVVGGFVGAAVGAVWGKLDDQKRRDATDVAADPSNEDDWNRS